MDAVITIAPRSPSASGSPAAIAAAALLVQISDRDPRAARDELTGGRLAKTRGATGDERSNPVQLHGGGELKAATRKPARTAARRRGRSRRGGARPRGARAQPPRA